MNWGKNVLIFQAIVTLVIGGVFFVNVLRASNLGIDEMLLSVDGAENRLDEQGGFVDIKSRFETAAYVLMIISLIELVIISRLEFSRERVEMELD